MKFWKSKKKKNVQHYGDDKTIHATTHLDVEVDKNGIVVAVWYRCQPLSFLQIDVDEQRAEQMRRLDEHQPLPGILAIDLALDEEDHGR